MQYCISAEEEKKTYQALAENKNISCVSVIFLQHPDECSSDSSTWDCMRIRLFGPKMGSMATNPIYPMAPVIFSWEHIPDVRENECRDVFSLYIKLFDVKVDASCSMEPCGNLLAAYLKFSWFLVVCFVCQLYIAELRLLFGGHRTIELNFLAS